MDVLVTYDIDTTSKAGERRLTRVAKVCEGYGVRVQKSVFECRLSTAGLARMIVDLTAVMDRSTDSIHFYRFEGVLQESRTSLGRGVPHELGRPWVV